MSEMVGGRMAPLERYLDATAVSAPPDLAGRIGARLLLEPPSTSPRRFLAALRTFDLCMIGRGLAQNVSVGFRPGTRSMLLRAQAMAIVLVTLSTVGFGSIAGLAATKHAVDEVRAWVAEAAMTSPAAPAAPTEQLEDRRPGGSGPKGQPGFAEAPGQACGLPAHAKADHLRGSEAERCPDGPNTGQPSRNKPSPENPAADRGKVEPPAGERVDSGRAKPPSPAKSADAGQGSALAAKRPEARASGDRKERSRPNAQGESRRDRN
jgi:hypothetical protein